MCMHYFQFFQGLWIDMWKRPVGYITIMIGLDGNGCENSR